MISDNMTFPSFMKFDEKNGIITGRASMISYNDCNTSSIIETNITNGTTKFNEVYSNE